MSMGPPLHSSANALCAGRPGRPARGDRTYKGGAWETAPRCLLWLEMPPWRSWPCCWDFYVIRLCVCVAVKKKKKKMKEMSISESASESLSFFTQTIYLFIQLNEFNHLFPLGLAGLPVYFKHLAVVLKKKKRCEGEGVCRCGGYLEAIVMKISPVPEEMRA